MFANVKSNYVYQLWLKDTEISSQSENNIGEKKDNLDIGSSWNVILIFVQIWNVRMLSLVAEVGKSISK